jgi:hypothetical protein
MAKHRNQAELFLDGQFLVKVLRPFWDPCFATWISGGQNGMRRHREFQQSEIFTH